jgi:hypothetical protein
MYLQPPPTIPAIIASPKHRMRWNWAHLRVAPNFSFTFDEIYRILKRGLRSGSACLQRERHTPRGHRAFRAAGHGFRIGLSQATGNTAVSRPPIEFARCYIERLEFCRSRYNREACAGIEPSLGVDGFTERLRGLSSTHRRSELFARFFSAFSSMSTFR